MADPRRTRSSSSGQPASDFVARFREIHKGGWLAVHRQADRFRFADLLKMVTTGKEKTVASLVALFIAWIFGYEDGRFFLVPLIL
jgi:hypothetical protein